MAGGRVADTRGAERRDQGGRPSNRGEYLGRDSVIAFIEWLRPRVAGTEPFKHSYQMLKPVCLWHCGSLREAQERYCWGGEDFAATQEKLDGWRCEIRAANETEDNGHFVAAALTVLKWGGVTPRNSTRLCELGQDALTTFRAAACRLEPSRADTSQLGEVQYMNSGWTKVYSLMLDDFPIYDGRVGAAMGYLVRRYCEDKGLSEVPKSLRFRWLAGKSNHNRNPSSGSLTFSPLSYTHQGRKTWAACNVWTAWILGEVCGEGRFGNLPEAYRLRALEAALFMIGYELPRHSP